LDIQYAINIMAGALYDNPRGRQAVTISSVFTALAVVIVGLRLYTRFCIIRCAGIEDFGILLAMVSQRPIPPIMLMLTLS
jgi:hypothetical protein